MYIPLTIIEFDYDNYNILKNKMDMFEPEGGSASPEDGHAYDIDGKSGQ